MSTLAGNGKEGYALGGGLSQPASQAEFQAPHLAVDDSDHVYVATAMTPSGWNMAEPTPPWLEAAWARAATAGRRSMPA